MKKFFIIAFIIALVFIGFKIKGWYDNNEATKANQAYEILSLKGVVQEDSSTIAIQTNVIEEGAEVQASQKKNIVLLREKYKSRLDSYTKLQVMFDSLRATAGKDTVITETDSTDSTVQVFLNEVGNGWFEIYGAIKGNTRPFKVFDLNLIQLKPIYVDVSVERISSSEFVTFINYSPPFLNVKKIQSTKVIDPRTFWEKLDLVMGVGYPAVGAGLKYNSFSAMYLRTFDSHGVMLNYYKNVSEIF